jgi:uncharacterized protein (TIGR02246 family)
VTAHLPTDRTADDAEIRQLFDDLLDAWTRGDAIAYGETFTADVDYIPYDGSRSTGRDEVVESHDQLFRGVLRGSALVGEIETIRYLRPDVAIVHTFGSVLMPWRTSLPERRLSRQTIVAVRGDDGWRFTAFHNARVRPRQVPGPDSFPSRASRFLTRVAGKRRAPQETGPEPARNP